MIASEINYLFTNDKNFISNFFDQLVTNYNLKMIIYLTFKKLTNLII